MNDPSVWFVWIERFGLPIVALVVIVFLLAWGIRAVWGFMKPLVGRAFEAFMGLIQKQSEFIDKVGEHQDELKGLIESGLGGHATTHGKLDGIGRKVDDIHSRVGGGR